MLWPDPEPYFSKLRIRIRFLPYGYPNSLISDFCPLRKKLHYWGRGPMLRVSDLQTGWRTYGRTDRQMEKINYGNSSAVRIKDSFCYSFCQMHALVSSLNYVWPWLSYSLGRDVTSDTAMPSEPNNAKIWAPYNEKLFFELTNMTQFIWKLVFAHCDTVTIKIFSIVHLRFDNWGDKGLGIKSSEIYCTQLHLQTGLDLFMVPIFDGNSEHVAHVWRKLDLFEEKHPNFDCSRSDQMP